jgi:hypothetical protein
MRQSLLVAAATLVLVPLTSASAWNSTGHLIAAYIAYTNLSPKVKVQIDEILRHHPDYPTWVEGQPKDKADRALTVFLIASTWPDLIKTDERFYDEYIADVHPTPLVRGFPDMERHRNWHYIDVPFSTDGSPTSPAPLPNAVMKFSEFTADLQKSGGRSELKAYKLVWLMHIVVDLHQPLHSVNRFTKRQVHGDNGGHAFSIDDPAGNLHKFWDGAIGTSVERSWIISLAKLLSNENKPQKPPSIQVEDWIRENHQLATEFVYTIGSDEPGEPPPALPTEYISHAGNLSRQRIALAGYRLARILNELMK